MSTLNSPTAWRWISDHVGTSCACAGECGTRHKETVCGKDQRKELFAAPADPRLSETRAAQVATAELMTWCRSCHTAAKQRLVGDVEEIPGQVDALDLLGWSV